MLGPVHAESPFYSKGSSEPNVQEGKKNDDSGQTLVVEEKIYNERPLDDVDSLMENLFSTIEDTTSQISFVSEDVIETHQITLIKGKLAEKTEGEAGKTGQVAEKTEGEAGKTGQVAEKTEGEAGKTGQVAEKTEGEAGKTGQVAEKTEGEAEETAEVVVITEVVVTKTKQEAVLDRGVLDAICNIEIENASHLADVQTRVYVVDLSTAKPQFIAGTKVSLEEVRENAQKGNIAIPDFKKGNLWVTKEAAKKIGPKVELYNENSGQTHLLNVQIISDEDLSQITKTLDRCIVKNYQLLQSRQQGQSGEAEIRRNGNIVITKTEKKEGPRHDKIDSKREVIKDSFKIEIPVLSSIECRMFFKRAAKIIEETKNEEHVKIQSDIEKKDEKYWAKIYDIIGEYVSEHNIKAGNLFRELKSVITPIYRWRGSQELADSFKKIVESRGLGAAEELVVILEKYPKAQKEGQDVSFMLCQVLARRLGGFIKIHRILSLDVSSYQDFKNIYSKINEILPAEKKCTPDELNKIIAMMQTISGFSQLGEGQMREILIKISQTLLEQAENGNRPYVDEIVLIKKLASVVSYLAIK